MDKELFKKQRGKWWLMAVSLGPYDVDNINNFLFIFI